MTTLIENKDFSFVRVGNVEDFPPGKGASVKVVGKILALFHIHGEFFALRDRCTHAEAPLSQGTVKGKLVTCPRHGAHFDLRTGVVLTPQAVQNAESYEVRVEDGQVYVSTESNREKPLWIKSQGIDLGTSKNKDCETGGSACRKQKKNRD